MLVLALLACASSPDVPPLPSPGLVVSVTGGQAPGLVVMAPDGSQARRLTDGTFDAGPAWSPDGGRIAFTRQVEAPAQQDHPCDLAFHGAPMVLDAVSGRVELVAEVPAVVGSLRWSPEGKRVAFWTAWGDDAACNGERFGTTRVWIAAADGSGARELGAGAMPEWSPRGDALAIVRDGTVSTVSPDGAPIRTLFAPEDPRRGAVAALWSTDGDTVALTTTSVSVTRTWTAPAAGGPVSARTGGEAWEVPVAFTPDGLLLAATYAGPPEDAEIVHVVDGARTAVAPDPGQDLEPALSRDGRVAFRSDRDGAWELYVVSLDGSGLTRLTHDAAAIEMAPAWRP